jgi:hypothetical protein
MSRIVGKKDNILREIGRRAMGLTNSDLRGSAVFGYCF